MLKTLKQIIKMAIYKRNLTPGNPNNPLSDFIKFSAKLTRISPKLLDNEIVIGRSSTRKEDHKHHILDRNLFPIKGIYGKGTKRIRVSEATHLKLHKLIANATKYEDFLVYENAVKDEFPDITLSIADIYVTRIAELRMGPITFIKYLLYARKKRRKTNINKETKRNKK